ncbi:MAG: PBECR2 nuclease fold domain-containing protein [Bacteroidales bacterium]|nr:PBECR2 nuclease fold domain-containing protein [Bacteroidales bacterium]MCM1416025.1 PBECR2 nuclease fold domain-containing protein [bacterium]MCM1423836.1 PBECR2 nuclease fold domain-containing protein [bacterium]
MVEILSLGTLNVSVFEKEFGKLRTNEIIITGERITHIREHHLIDYELFEKYGAQCVQNPDYIIKDNKNKNTVFMIKKLSNTNLNVVSKLALDTDKKELKNSVMTFYRIRERNLTKLLSKNIILYKKK